MYGAIPGAVICPPGARKRLLDYRVALRVSKITTKVDYISFLMSEGTHFEENQMSKKMEIFAQTSSNVDGYLRFSTSATEMTTNDLYPFLHPCIRQERYLRDMAIDFQRFMSRGDVPRRLRLLFYLTNNVAQTRATRMFVLQSIKFDGEEMGIPITHVYATREFHPGNVARNDASVTVYSRFDFVEAMYYVDDQSAMVPGNCATLHNKSTQVVQYG